MKLAKILPWSLLMLALPAFAVQTVSIDGMISLVVYLVIIALIFWVVWWFIGYVGVPEPFNKVIRVVMGLIALLVVISILLGMLGQPVMNFR